MTHDQLAGFRIQLRERASIEIITEHDLSYPAVYLVPDFSSGCSNKRGGKFLN
jgi:hypothetical protein